MFPGHLARDALRSAPHPDGVEPQSGGDAVHGLALPPGRRFRLSRHRPHGRGGRRRHHLGGTGRPETGGVHEPAPPAPAARGDDSRRGRVQVLQRDGRAARSGVDGADAHGVCVPHPQRAEETAAPLLGHINRSPVVALWRVAAETAAECAVGGAVRATLSVGGGHGFDVRADRVHPGLDNMLVEPRVFYCLSGGIGA